MNYVVAFYINIDQILKNEEDKSFDTLKEAKVYVEQLRRDNKTIIKGLEAGGLGLAIFTKEQYNQAGLC